MSGFEQHPALDMTDFTPEQMERVRIWYAQAERLARLDELIRLGQAGREQNMHSVTAIQSYIMARAIMLSLDTNDQEETR